MIFGSVSQGRSEECHVLKIRQAEQAFPSLCMSYLIIYFFLHLRSPGIFHFFVSSICTANNCLGRWPWYCHKGNIFSQERVLLGTIYPVDQTLLHQSSPGLPVSTVCLSKIYLALLKALSTRYISFCRLPDVLQRDQSEL